MTTLIERLAAYTVGSVIAVSPQELVVALDLEAPQATALNTGTPTGFPRINAAVLIPNESGAVVGTVSRISISKLPYPRLREGEKLVDLPVPMRVLELTPTGTLVSEGVDDQGTVSFRLIRGVPVLPSVGDPVLLPSRDQLRSIVEGHGDDRRVQIGIAPFAGNAKVTVDPDKLFGRHIAVLGNTGSGKSCSVAGLIRWCMEAAGSAAQGTCRDDPNARFIVLDPNGEYGSAFDGDGVHCRKFAVGGSGQVEALAVPGWLWNSQEWAAFTNAQPGSQRPILMKSLRILRNATPSLETTKAQLHRRASGLLRQYRQVLDNFPDSVCGFPANKNFGEGLLGLVSGIQSDLSKLPTESHLEPELKAALMDVADVAESTRTRRSWVSNGRTGYNDFHQIDVEGVVATLYALTTVQKTEQPGSEVSEDSPVPFDVGALPNTIEDVARASGGNAVSNVEPLINRIQVMLGDGRMAPIIATESGTNLVEWLNSFVGADKASNGQVAVIDLSLVPSDVVHVTVAVISRLVFEAVQRYKKAHPKKKPLPTTLVLEEAHTFIRRDGEHGTNAPAADTCRQTFERIAREGRKFGLGLLLSSQRPSELSPTVLAQCNTFLLHRIVNDLDQALVRKLVPDALGGLLGELPTLPSQQAILLGWATPLPVLVRMRDLERKHRPQSDDPDFWSVWTGEADRKIDWAPIAAEWEA